MPVVCLVVFAALSALSWWSDRRSLRLREELSRLDAARDAKIVTMLKRSVAIDALLQARLARVEQHVGIPRKRPEAPS